MKLPELKIGNLVAKIPIIQGGMSIRISSGRLAGAVAATGAIGVIGASGLGHDELAEEIKIARKLANGGIVGINILYAASDFLGIVHTAVREKIDFITTGAGFSRDIFKIGHDANIPIVPIVSSAKLAKISIGLGAAAIVGESSEAGGHLGTLEKSTDELLKELREVVTDVPLIIAGGLANGKDIARVLKDGANAAQLATIFILAEECNAAKEYKIVHQKATDPKEVLIIHSPVGMPGRALRTAFIDKITRSDYPGVDFCDSCLKQCSRKYCIFEKLRNAQVGNVDDGVVFSGDSVTKIKDKRIRPAKDIVAELVKEAEEFYGK